MLTDQDKRTALKIARYSLESIVIDHVKPTPEEIECIYSPSQALKQYAGVFVTIYPGRGENTSIDHRGCIGYMVGIMPTYQAIVDNALNAGTRDDRYTPVQPDEVENTSITISVLGPMVPCTPDDFVLGEHGLTLELGENFGVYLPQIPIQQGWDRMRFLKELGIKAGVDEDAWKNKNSIMHKFTAQVFSENDFPDLYDQE